jgi:hypothetical protein
MEEALLLIEEFQGWIYILLGIVGLVYLRVFLKWHAEVSRSVFGLEREQASGHRSRAAAMLVLAIVGIVVTFLIATFVGPSIPISSRPTPIPTISLFSAEEPLVTESENLEGDSATPIVVETVDNIGCQNPDATLSSPVDGEQIRGIVEVYGTADISNFAFYKIEYRSTSTDSVWRAISAGTETVREDLLGVWDTSLVLTGTYELRLVVTDTEGNAPFPCELGVRVAPSP